MGYLRNFYKRSGLVMKSVDIDEIVANIEYLEEEWDLTDLFEPKGTTGVPRTPVVPYIT
jgi:hypothetical protein